MQPTNTYEVSREIREEVLREIKKDMYLFAFTAVLFCALWVLTMNDLDNNKARVQYWKTRCTKAEQKLLVLGHNDERARAQGAQPPAHVRYTYRKSATQKEKAKP